MTELVENKLKELVESTILNLTNDETFISMFHEQIKERAVSSIEKALEFKPVVKTNGSYNNSNTTVTTPSVIDELIIKEAKPILARIIDQIIIEHEGYFVAVIASAFERHIIDAFGKTAVDTVMPYVNSMVGSNMANLRAQLTAAGVLR